MGAIGGQLDPVRYQETHDALGKIASRRRFADWVAWRATRSAAARHFGVGPYRTHGLRFTPRTWVTLLARRDLQGVRAYKSRRAPVSLIRDQNSREDGRACSRNASVHYLECLTMSAFGALNGPHHCSQTNALGHSHQLSATSHGKARSRRVGRQKIRKSWTAGLI
jgi:hypothetical protein